MSTHCQSSRTIISLFLVFSSYGFIAAAFMTPSSRCTVQESIWPTSAFVKNHEEGLTASNLNVPLARPATVHLNATLLFPSCNDLLLLRPGDFVESKVLKVESNGMAQSRFRIKLYPRGFISDSHSTSTCHNKKKNTDGFGMSYRILPLFAKQVEERAGIFLQYLPDSTNDSVDATFCLRLKGNQIDGPKFDIEWRSGMRFVSLEHSKLAEGRANDFGAHLLQTKLLQTFAGGSDGNAPLQLQMGITVHECPPNKTSDAVREQSKSSPIDWLNFDDIRMIKDPAAANQHNRDVHVGRIVVPILQKLSQRQKMFQQGAYPGVEYRIMRISDPQTDADLFQSRPGANYELKPIYPLVQELERQWPIQINERDIPKLYTPAMYNAVSAIGSLFTAVTGLVAAFVISQAVSLFVIPSLSMDPTLQVGDVLLVDKITPRILPQYNHRPDSVVLFHPPAKLQEIIAQSAGRSLSDRDLFVKRVAAESGDVLTVTKSGSVSVNGKDVTKDRRDLCVAEPLRLIERYIEPHDGVNPLIVPPNQVVVLGDCASVSIDSRVWGTLPFSDIVGRPILRLWPLSRFGAVPDLPTTMEWEH
ncbi:hypothetical protein MPSEU_000942700 [Mayamaea pseudoterrestris]|nr:hypothetical protein MPSEU_000942700 [Mayamaea pseudoterrestris]